MANQVWNPPGLMVQVISEINTQEVSVRSRFDRLASKVFTVQNIFETKDPEIDQLFQRLRGSAEIPTALEQSKLDACLKDEIHDLEETHHRVLAEITELAHRYAEINCKLVQKLRQVNVVRTFTSPIRRLPMELWAEIFCMCLPEGEGEPPQRLQAPLLLSQVCKSWQQISYSIPQLWDKIKLRVYNTKRLLSQGLNGSANMLAFYAERSEPRHLSCTFVTTLTRSRLVNRQSIETIIRSHSDRFGSLSFFYPFCGADLSELNILNGVHFNNLQRLKLSAGDCDKWNSVAVFASSPQLRQVALSLVLRRQSLFSAIQLPWEQLTALELAQMEIGRRTFRVLMHKCIRLEKGAFTVKAPLSNIDSGEALDSPEVMECSFLNQLVIYSSYTLTNILQGISFPTLDTLQVYAHPGGTGETSHLQLSGLHRLTVGVSIPFPALVALLEYSHDIKKVQLDLKDDVDNERAKRLIEWLSFRNIFPQLEELTIRLNKFLPISEALVAMIRSRIASSGHQSHFLVRVLLVDALESRAVIKKICDACEPHLMVKSATSVHFSDMIPPCKLWKE